jgi:hypothetical protein
VLLGVVLGRVPEGRVDAALGRAGVAADRVDLREESYVSAEIESLDGRAHSRAAGAYHEDVVLGLH